MTNYTFDDYVNNPDFTSWKGFPQFIMSLGFNFKEHRLYPSVSIELELSPKEYVDVFIRAMEAAWTLNQVGCYIYARWYTLLHASINYDNDKQMYFFNQALPMLKRKIENEKKKNR